jgi:hypothetical protein
VDAAVESAGSLMKLPLSAPSHLRTETSVTR